MQLPNIINLGFQVLKAVSVQSPNLSQIEKLTGTKINEDQKSFIKSNKKSIHLAATELAVSWAWDVVEGFDKKDLSTRNLFHSIFLGISAMNGAQLNLEEMMK